MLNDRQKNDLDNYITGHYGEDQLRNERPEDESDINEDKLKQRLDREIADCTQAVDKVTGPYDFERDIAWAQLGFVTQENCKRQLRRQKRQAFYKWAGVVLFVISVIVLALVAMNQIP